MTASRATEKAGALAKVRSFSVTLNDPVWKNLIALVSPDEFDHCEYNAYFTAEA